MYLRKRLKEAYVQTAQILKGSERRLFMARVVKMLGPGGQRYAERELGWNRGTIRKGMQELDSGRLFQDRFSDRGRKSIDHHLPNLAADIGIVIETKGKPGRQRRIGISCRRIKDLLVEEHGYDRQQLPSRETIRKKVHQLGYGFKPGLR